MKPGDCIGIVSVASPQPKKSWLEPDLVVLKKWGFSYKLAPHVYKYSHAVLDSLPERVADFETMLIDPEIDAIMFAYGGAHTINLVDELNYNLVKQNPKPIIGYSDNTFLLVSINTVTDQPTYWGPTACYSPSHMNHFAKKAFLSLLANEPLELKTQKRWRVLRPGQVSGKLIGGNLAALQALLGTPYEPDWQGKILYFEHFSTPSILISETLNHFRLAGVFGKIAGMLVGTLPGCIAKDQFEDPQLRGEIGLDRIIQFQARGYDFPIIANFDIGHDVVSFVTMGNGLAGSMDTENGVVEVGTVKLTNSPYHCSE